MHECLVPNGPKDIVHPTPASGTGMEIPDYYLQCSWLCKLLSLSPEREEMESKGVTHPGVERKSSSLLCEPQDIKDFSRIKVLKQF